MIAANRIVFVVATKDRPEELRRLWRSLLAQTRVPDEVVVVDAGVRQIPRLAAGAGAPAFRLIRTSVASAARQRNLGLDAVGPDAWLVGFLDDDAVLEAGAVEEIARFFAAAGPGVGGAAFNMVNHPPLEWDVLKGTPLVAALGLYDRRSGVVTPSGFQTMLGPVETTTWVDWLPTGASVWRREIFREFRFDDWFGGYSYLEDLDFSYRVGRTSKLAVVAGARYLHLPAPGGRGGGYAFGVREVLNRVHFVRKHAELSLPKCRAALTVRLGLSLVQSVRQGSAYYAARAFGNAVGLVRSGLETG
jgi:GT2 family glycosyltransferase